MHDSNIYYSNTHRSDILRSRAQRSQNLYLAAALTTALVIQLVLAWRTTGTLDLVTWVRNLEDVREVGGLGLYHKPYTVAQYFNVLPSMIHYIKVLNLIVDLTDWPARFVVRLPSILANFGTFFVVARLLNLPQNSTRTVIDDKDRFRKLLCLAIAPPAIMIAGFHGNTDAIMMFFFMLTLLLLQNCAPMWMCGIAFGLSICVKVVPLMFLPVILLHLRHFRRCAVFSSVAVTTVLVGCSPYIFQDTHFIVNRVFGYTSGYGWWGITRVLEVLQPPDSLFTLLFTKYGKWVLLCALTLCSFWISRPEKRLLLFQQCAIITCLFFIITPGYGSQYLIWLVPLVISLGLSSTLLYYATSGIYLLLNYSFWGYWRASYITIFIQHWNWVRLTVLFELFCWICCVLIFLRNFLPTVLPAVSRDDRVLHIDS